MKLLRTSRFSTKFRRPYVKGTFDVVSPLDSHFHLDLLRRSCALRAETNVQPLRAALHQQLGAGSKLLRRRPRGHRSRAGRSGEAAHASGGMRYSRRVEVRISPLSYLYRCTSNLLCVGVVNLLRTVKIVYVRGHLQHYKCTLA